MHPAQGIGSLTLSKNQFILSSLSWAPLRSSTISFAAESFFETTLGGFDRVEDAVLFVSILTTGRALLPIPTYSVLRSGQN